MKIGAGGQKISPKIWNPCMAYLIQMGFLRISEFSDSWTNWKIHSIHEFLAHKESVHKNHLLIKLTLHNPLGKFIEMCFLAIIFSSLHFVFILYWDNYMVADGMANHFLKVAVATLVALPMVHLSPNDSGDHFCLYSGVS